ncbi:MAG: hypothetical protein IMX04_06895 [Candidatus Carbobacillus altaicus]|uniref:Uncharacterized protein n=1 Tax=Candidatus Carbonibacillus altaicus TaxID=2163959 RepID=A0A2R6XXU0_9BACL|nr:hypothetical protein [Candidatus Carbobacillus altaicus]PTQ55233.1 MAG: hypothetical protein BSOLF_2844 [Candidatus Carbobacillus altaicus]
MLWLMVLYPIGMLIALWGLYRLMRSRLTCGLGRAGSCALPEKAQTERRT